MGSQICTCDKSDIGKDENFGNDMSMYSSVGKNTQTVKKLNNTKRKSSEKIPEVSHVKYQNARKSDHFESNLVEKESRKQPKVSNEFHGDSVTFKRESTSKPLDQSVCGRTSEIYKIAEVSSSKENESRNESPDVRRKSNNSESFTFKKSTDDPRNSKSSFKPSQIMKLIMLQRAIKRYIKLKKEIQMQVMKSVHSELVDETTGVVGSRTVNR